MGGADYRVIRIEHITIEIILHRAHFKVESRTKNEHKLPEPRLSTQHIKFQANATLQGKTPREIIAWTVDRSERVIVTTSFGQYSAVMLHLATTVRPDIPVVWVDSGYNTRETYLHAEKLIKDLNLNIHIFTPQMTAARWEALASGIPTLDNKLHKEFTYRVKLEPFERVIQTLKPEYWLTAIRKDETAYRESLDILSDGPQDIIKVAPFLNWKEIDMEAYLYEHQLPQVQNYYDPTKGKDDRECGLQTMHESAYMGEGI